MLVAKENNFNNVCLALQGERFALNLFYLFRLNDYRYCGGLFGGIGHPVSAAKDVVNIILQGLATLSFFHQYPIPCVI